MSGVERLRIVLDIEAEAQPITGVLSAPDGSNRAFCGWTGLAAAIEWAVEPDPEQETTTGE
jgi:hypothetical protein